MSTGEPVASWCRRVEGAFGDEDAFDDDVLRAEEVEEKITARATMLINA